MSKYLAPIILRNYDKLEKREEKLRKQLERLHTAHRSTVARIVRDGYVGSVRNGKVSSATLERPVDHADAARLAHQAKTLGAEFDNPDTYPFNVARFDKLNRLEAIRLELNIAELKLAKNEFDLILDHLAGYSEDLWVDLMIWLGKPKTEKLAKEALAEILEDKKYPIKHILAKNHANIAERATEGFARAIHRSASIKEVEERICDYVMGREKTRTDAVIYYEGTRVTSDTVKAAVEDIAESFRTVTWDEKACDTCSDIERKQKRNPVSFKDFEIGVTAPPFHTFCRCYIEVNIHDND